MRARSSPIRTGCRSRAGALARQSRRQLLGPFTRPYSQLCLQVSGSDVPRPVKPRQGREAARESLARGRSAAIRNKHQPISIPAAKTAWSRHAGAFPLQQTPKKTSSWINPPRSQCQPAAAGSKEQLVPSQPAPAPPNLGSNNQETSHANAKAPAPPSSCAGRGGGW